MLGDEAKVRAVLRDFRTAPLSGAEHALFAYIAQLNQSPASIRREDVDRLLAAGWSQAAVYDAITVCALFNFYNRWIDGSGVHGLTAEGYRESGRRLARFGYAPAPAPARRPTLAGAGAGQP